MHRVFQYRIYPTYRQAAALTDMLRDHCTLYNVALQEHKDAYKWGGVSVKYAHQTAQLTEIRRADEQYSQWSAASQRCYACGHTAENRDKEKFRCVKCGHTDHADTNAAKNILRLGLSLRTAVEPSTA